jgi:ElaB/YqjD/DUF883 family membrane-anchored ribosome-binding protein
MAPKQKRNGKIDIDGRLRTLRADLDVLQQDMKAFAGDVGEVANDRAQLALRSAEDVAERAYRLAEEAATQANKRALEAVDDVEEWADDNLKSVRESVQEQPLAAMLISLGVGAFLGALFLRR